MHEQANADRPQALQALLPFDETGALITPAQFGQELAHPGRLRILLNEARTGTTLQDQADDLDAHADRLEAGTTNGQIEALIGLSVSFSFLREHTRLDDHPTTG